MSSKSTPLSYHPAPIPERVRVGAPGTSLNPEAVFKTLQNKFSASAVKAFHNKHKGDPWMEISADALIKVMGFLRDDQDMQFIALQVVSGTDYLGQAAAPAEGDKAAVPAVPARIEVVYVLYSYAFRTQITVKVICDRDHAKVPSICQFFRCANWYEREIYDVLGVVFEGHPDHKRILLPLDWVGHPLRKDYIFPEEYNGMKVPL